MLKSTCLVAEGSKPFCNSAPTFSPTVSTNATSAIGGKGVERQSDAHFCATLGLAHAFLGLILVGKENSFHGT